MGTEIDLPIVIMVDQDEAAFLPQVAVEGAWRFLAYSMLGLGAQLVVLAYGSDRFGVATSLEPFLRIAHADRDIGWFVLLAGEIYLGPDHPFAPVDPRGSISPKLGGGLLF